VAHVRSGGTASSWVKFVRLVARFFPPIKTLHPLPCHCFAVAAHDRIRFGGGGNPRPATNPKKIGAARSVMAFAYTHDVQN
jgi:hypothetical protein